MSIPKLDLAKVLKDGASGGLNLSVSVVANGIQITINSNLSQKQIATNLTPTASSSPLANEHETKTFVFNGTAAEIKTAVESDIKLGLLFK